MLEVATAGGASVLGRDDIGRLRPGLEADVIAIDMNRVEYSGAVHDLVAALVFCAPGRVTHSWVGGEQVVEDGRLVGVDEITLVAEHNRLAGLLTR